MQLTPWKVETRPVFHAPTREPKWLLLLRWALSLPWTLSTVWALVLYTFLQADIDPWTQWPPLGFALAATLPMAVLTLRQITFLKAKAKAAGKGKGRRVRECLTRLALWRYAGSFFALVWGLAAADTALRTYDPDCRKQIGEGLLHGAAVTVLLCEPAGGLEPWIAVRPTPRVGMADDGGGKQSIAASEFFPELGKGAAFPSRPVAANLGSDGRLEVRFSDGRVRSRFVKADPAS